MATTAVAKAARYIPAQERGQFAPVPLHVLSAPGLTDGAKLLFGLLAKFAGTNGDCHPSQDRLAHDLGKSSRQVRRLIGELEGAGLIEVETPLFGERARGKAASYFFTRPTPDTHVLCTPDTDVRSTPDIHDHGHRTQMSAQNTLKRKQKPQQHKGGCCASPSGEEVKSQELTPEQEEYISLKVQANLGKPVKNKGALRAALVRKACAGELDMSDLEDLRDWRREQEADLALQEDFKRQCREIFGTREKR